jgi:PAS domain S-box-containing protein
MSLLSFSPLKHIGSPAVGRGLQSTRDDTGWDALPRAAQVYVAAVIAAGGVLLGRFFPTTLSQPLMFTGLMVFSCLTSVWKVTLPLSLRSGSTLSVSYAADLMALLLLGPQQAMVIAVAGAWTQCAFRVRQPYPWYRTVFSMAAEAITIQTTGLVYASIGGAATLVPMASLPKALVAAIATYFIVNTVLVAGAIALSTRQRAWNVWHDNFLWIAPSFMVAGAAGAVAAMVIDRGNPWLAILMLMPVYLSYRSYQVFLGRIEDERRHAEETKKLHSEAIEALLQARRAEQALADEKERLAVTLRSIGDGVITTDLTGTVLLINHAAEALTGWTLQEAVGRPLDAMFRNVDPETREACDNSVAMLTRNPGKVVFNRSSVLMARDSTERPIEETAAPLRDAAGHTIGMVMVFRDITDALKVQEERAKAGRIASLGLLAGGIAHDFNNILMNIMGNLSMARVSTSGRGASRALDEAQRACLRARQLTWQLLTFSRGSVPHKRTLSIPQILKESADLALRGSNVTCVFDIAPDLWPVPADEEQLSQVINNMVVNAQQAMPHGGAIEIRAENIIEPGQRWEHALRVEPGRYIRVSFADRGIGIPEQNLGRIFDPYFSTKQKGSGLGLATSYSIVKNHGGYVSVASKLGQGTTLTVNLPAATGEVAVESIASVPAGASRILVMDDEASVRGLTVRMLKALGHTVEVVENGTAAVEQYAQALKTGQPFDAILLDLIVPCGLGGREALELISEIDPAVKAIMVSGYAQNSETTEFQEYGFKAVIAKPFTLEELKRTLHEVILPANYEELKTTIHTVMLPGTWQVH